MDSQSDSTDNNILPAAEPAVSTLVKKRQRSRKRSIIIFVVVSLVNAGLLALLWSQLLTAAPGQSSTGDNSALDPLKGHVAPNFTLTALSASASGGGNGANLDLASFKGKPIVLNFWSSSCVPCQDEATLLQSTWQEMKAKGVVFIGVDFQDAQSAGVSFMQRYSITYPNALDANGAIAINY